MGNAQHKDAWLEAASNGGIAEMRTMLDAGLDKDKAVSFIDKECKTALHIATQFGDYDMVLFLVDELQASPLVLDKYNYTPLHHAAELGHLTIAEFLLERGALVNARALNDITPLHCAARCNHMLVTKLLLDAGALVNLPTSQMLDCQTALHFASGGEDWSNLHQLLQAGGNPNALDVAGRPAVSPEEARTRKDAFVLRAIESEPLNQTKLAFLQGCYITQRVSKRGLGETQRAKYDSGVGLSSSNAYHGKYYRTAIQRSFVRHPLYERELLDDLFDML